jgi:osmotically-inducible protein OsmY
VLLAAELGPSQPYRVIVRDGVVDLTGPADPVDRRLATLLAHGVPGVLKVHLDTE